MQMTYRGFAAAFIVAACIVTGGALSNAKAASSEGVAAFEGRWSGKVLIECSGVTAPLEITVEDGEMSGKLTVRGQGQGDGTYCKAPVLCTSSW